MKGSKGAAERDRSDQRRHQQKDGGNGSAHATCLQRLVSATAVEPESLFPARFAHIEVRHRFLADGL
jgi:hypothetical protein